MKKQNKLSLLKNRWRFDSRLRSSTIVLLCIFLILSCIFIANKISLFFGHENEWDALSFTGSIIGGFVTLFGIRYTIKHQRKDDFIRSFPDRLVNADKIISEAYQLEEKLKELFDARKYKHYGVALHSFLKKEDILKRESAVVGVDYYNNLSYIFSLGKTIYEEISSYDIEDQELFTKCNYYINYLNAVNEKLYELKLGLEIRFAEINI